MKMSLRSLLERANRNLLLLSGALAILVGAGIHWNRAYLYNAVFGPFGIDRDALLSISDPAQLRRNHVRVEGDRIIDTEFKNIESYTVRFSRELASERVSAHYVTVVIDQTLLLARLPSMPESSVVSGRLVPIPPALRAELVAALEVEHPDIQGAFLPFMIDGTAYGTDAYLWLLLGVSALGLALTAMGRAARGLEEPDQSPLVVGLARYGDRKKVIEEIDRELKTEAGRVRVGSALLTQSWIVVADPLHVDIMKISDVMWAHRNSLRPTKGWGRWLTGRRGLVLYDRHGRSLEVPGSDAVVDRLMEQVRRRVPWIIVGYNRNIEMLWNLDRLSFIAEVDARQRHGARSG